MGGQINHPIIIGNILVNPGDLVFADNDGVVIVLRAQAAEVYEQAFAREKKEEELLEKVKKDGTMTFHGNATFKAVFEKLGLSEEL
jgi:4-hydroxy-4-methyl-2-oxoglutarate aldolase